MDESLQRPAQLNSSIVTALIQHPYLFAVLLVLSCCIITRIYTGSQERKGDGTSVKGVPQAPPVISYWVPFIGHTASFGIWFTELLKHYAFSTPRSVYALRILGANHNIVLAPSLTKDLLNRPNLPIDNEVILHQFLTRGFGDKGVFRDWTARDPEEYWELAKMLHNLMKEPFLSNAIARTVEAVENLTYNLISGNPSWVDHSVWERAGQVEIVSQNHKDGSFVAEADLFNLLQDFVGDFAVRLLMGNAFLDNNPTFLQDLWTFDRKFMSLMTGMPYWLLPGGGPAVGARERMIEAVAEHHAAMFAAMDGKDAGYKYADLSDVSSLIQDRAAGFHKSGCDARTYGVGDLVLIWAMNVNAVPMVFWLIFYIYSHPDLLAQIRDEIKPYVTVERPPPTGLPVQEAPRLKMDINGLISNCPHLKGAFFETMRLELGSLSYRTVHEDFTLTESKEDAAALGKPQPTTYLFRKGEMICIPFKVHQDSPQHYRDPRRFDPRRFWVTKTDGETGEPKTTVEYGGFRPWGGGKTICKGRNWAEREVLGITAGILMVWNIQPVAKDGWKHPGDVITAGTYTPKNNIRVRMSRRDL